MCFHILLEEKKNETAGLYPTFQAQEIMIKMIINAIPQMRYKTTNATQDQKEFEIESKTNMSQKVKIK